MKSIVIFFKRNVNSMKALLVFVFILGGAEIGWAKDVELEALGIRGGMNFKNAGLHPGEKEDFEQFDVFAIMGLPLVWEGASGWELRSQLRGSAGALRGAGDLGFITTLTPGLALRVPKWRLIFDGGAGGALISKWEFGRQDIGGPFQFIAHVGVGVQLPGNMVVGWRFHHMSDATVYGDSRGVDFHMLEVGYYF